MVQSIFVRRSLVGLAILFPFSFVVLPFVARAGTLPQVHVTNLVISNHTVANGATVKGSFSLLNTSNTTASDVSSVVALVGGFKNGLPTIVYDRKDLGSLSLGAHESKEVSFSYSVPKTIGGEDVGIRIQAVFGGFYMGWADARLSIEGTSEVTFVKKTQLNINGKAYAAGMGAVVPEGGSVNFQVSLFNPTREAITVVPRVRIFDRVSTGQLLREFDASPSTLEAGIAKDIVVDLPVDTEPRVYAGEVSFTDTFGVVRGEVVSFRYMILGDMAYINSISSEKSFAQAGEAIEVTVFYNTPPFDPITRKAPSVGDANLQVFLFNELGEAVGNGEVRINLDDPSQKSIKVRVMVVKPAQKLTAKTLILKEGEVLAERSSQLYAVEKQLLIPPEPGTSAQLLIELAVSATFVLLLLLWFLFIKKQNRGDSDSLPPKDTDSGNTPLPGGGAGHTPLLLVLLGIIFLAFAFTQAIYAYTRVDGRGDIWEPSLFVNTPYDGQTFQSGSTMYVQGTQVYNQCSNLISADATFTIKFINAIGNQVGGTYTYVVPGDISNMGNEITSTFNLGPITVPSPPGAYQVKIADHIRVEAVSESGATYYEDDWTEGYVDIVVSPRLQSPTLTATPGVDGSCGVINVQWTRVSGAIGYALYRDEGSSSIYSGAGTSFVDANLAPGSQHTYRVFATSSNGNSPSSNVASAQASLCSALRASIIGAPNPAAVGQEVNWTVSVSGGFGPYTYSLSGTDGLAASGQTDDTQLSVVTTYTTVGTKTATITIASSDGQISTAQADVLVQVFQPVPTVTCSALPTTVIVGGKVTWTCVVNLSGDHAYSWSGDDGLRGTTLSVEKTYTTTGEKQGQFDVSDTSADPDWVGSVRVIDIPSFKEQ